jgi:hypothetical protein
VIAEPFLRHQGGADALVEGHYLLQRRRARRVDVPIRIWFGPPHDPVTGEEMDRSHSWHIEIAGSLFDEPLTIGGITFSSVTDFWPAIACEPIDEAEYRFRIERAAWSQQHDPDDALATPGGRINALTATLPGM